MHVDEINWFLAVGLLLGYVVINGLYVYYTIAIVKRRPILAASTSLVMDVIFAAGVLSYTENSVYIIPLGIGSFLGTYLVTRFTKQ